MWQPFFTLPGSLKLELLAIPQLPFNNATLPEFAALTIISLAVLIGCIFYFKSLKENLAAVILVSICLFSLLLTFNPFLNHRGFISVIGRLSSLSYIQTAIAAPLFLFLMQEFPKRKEIVMSLLLAAVIMASRFSPLPAGLRIEYLRQRETIANTLSEGKTQMCSDSFIIAAHGNQFLAASVTGFPSQQTPPGNSTEKCLYWLILNPPRQRVQFPESIGNEKTNFILVKHEVITGMLPTLKNNRLLMTVNPHLRRFISYRRNRGIAENYIDINLNRVYLSIHPPFINF